MTKLLFSILLICFITNPLFTRPNSETEIAKAVENLRKAILDANKEQLVQLTSSHLSYGHSSGSIEDKETFIATLTSGKADFQRLDMSDQTVQIVGNTAIVRNKWNATIKEKETAYDTTLGVLMIWTLEEGAWKLLARQAFKL